MAIVFDTASDYTHDNVNADPTWAHTVTPGGTGTIILVGFSARYEPGWALGVTYGGEALTLIDRQWQNNLDDGTGELWYLVNPPTGANNVVIDLPAGNTWVGCGAVSYTGVNPDDPIGTATKDFGNGAAIAAPAVTAEDGWLVVDVAASWHNAPAGLTEGAGQTERVDVGETSCGMSEEAGAVSVDMTWTHAAAGRDWAAIAVPLKIYFPFAIRPIEYTLDAWDPEQRILDSAGHEVPRYKIKPNNWCRIVGLESTTAEVYTSNYEDPTLVYFESVSYDGETDEVQIITNRGDLPEVIMARLASGSTG